MDRRVLKTKKAVRQAYLELLRKKKDHRGISVKDLVEEADINRSTFYLHYYDIDVVLEELIEMMFENISSRIPEQGFQVNEMEKIIGEMSKQIEENKDYSLLVSKASDLPYFSEAMLRMMMKKVSTDTISNPNLNEEDKHFLMQVISQMTCNLTSYMIRNYDVKEIGSRFDLIKEYIFEPSLQKIMNQRPSDNA